MKEDAGAIHLLSGRADSRLVCMDCVPTGFLKEMCHVKFREISCYLFVKFVFPFSRYFLSFSCPPMGKQVKLGTLYSSCKRAFVMRKKPEPLVTPRRPALRKAPTPKSNQKVSFEDDFQAKLRELKGKGKGKSKEQVRALMVAIVKGKGKADGKGGGNKAKETVKQAPLALKDRPKGEDQECEEEEEKEDDPELEVEPKEKKTPAAKTAAKAKGKPAAEPKKSQKSPKASKAPAKPKKPEPKAAPKPAAKKTAKPKPSEVEKVRLRFHSFL